MSKIKLFLAITSLLLTANVYAEAEGLYMGLMLGPAFNSAGNEEAQLAGLFTTTLVKPKSTQFGARIFMGYDFNPYFAIESGLAYFSNVDFTAINTTITAADLCSTPYASAADLDLLGKLMLPLGSLFGVYAKGGVAGIYERRSAALNPAESGGVSTCGVSTNEINIEPTFSLGGSFNLSQNWVLDLSYNKIYTGGVINSFSFYALGISYHFVERYCGQFICDD